jgi:hypothetical protein
MPRRCCALQDCLDPTCKICSIARAPLPVRCETFLENGQCRLIQHHQGPCRPDETKKGHSTRTRAENGPD